VRICSCVHFYKHTASHVALTLSAAPNVNDVALALAALVEPLGLSWPHLQARNGNGSKCVCGCGNVNRLWHPGILQNLPSWHFAPRQSVLIIAFMAGNWSIKAKSNTMCVC